jgi:hypothetical protein
VTCAGRLAVVVVLWEAVVELLALVVDETMMAELAFVEVVGTWVVVVLSPVVVETRIVEPL